MQLDHDTLALPPNKTNAGLIIDTDTIRQVADAKVSAMGWPKMELTKKRYGDGGRSITDYTTY